MSAWLNSESRHALIDQSLHEQCSLSTLKCKSHRNPNRISIQTPTFFALNFQVKVIIVRVGKCCSSNSITHCANLYSIFLASSYPVDNYSPNRLCLQKSSYCIKSRKQSWDFFLVTSSINGLFDALGFFTWMPNTFYKIHIRIFKLKNFSKVLIGLQSLELKVFNWKPIG